MLHNLKDEIEANSHPPTTVSLDNDFNFKSTIEFAKLDAGIIDKLKKYGITTQDFIKYRLMYTFLPQLPFLGETNCYRVFNEDMRGFKEVGVFGTILSMEARAWDYEELSYIVNHEKRHAEDWEKLKDAANPECRLYCYIYQQLVAKNVSDPLGVADRYMDFLMEAKNLFEGFKDPNVSYNFLSQVSTHQLCTKYHECLSVLRSFSDPTTRVAIINFVKGIRDGIPPGWEVFKDTRLEDFICEPPKE
ncbi:MAG: hypothetical protein V1709_05525 [Planctomycetota bacterium]